MIGVTLESENGGLIEEREKALPQDAVIPARGGDEDGRRDLTLLRHVPARVEIVLRIIPGVV